MLYFGAIDVGSNAVRLLIQQVDLNKKKSVPQKIYLTRIPLRLGQEVFTTSYISKEKERQLMHVMNAFRELMEAYNIIDYRACATAAMRDARNNTSIAKAIREECKIDLEIINGRQEADLIIGNDSLREMLAPEKSYLFVDVGGGSTEISLIEKGEIRFSDSFNIGTLRLLNHSVNPIEKKRLSETLQHLVSHSKEIELVGSGGNINRLFRLSGCQADTPLSVNVLNGIYKKLHALTVEERMQTFQLKPDRADVIVPAAEIFLTIAQEVKASQVWVPTIGIADGIIHRLYTSYLEKYKFRTR